MNGFLDTISSKFDPKHGFLSSIEAEISAFLPKKAAISLVYFHLRPSYKYFNVASLPELMVSPQRPFIPKLVLLFTL